MVTKIKDGLVSIGDISDQRSKYRRHHIIFPVFLTMIGWWHCLNTPKFLLAYRHFLFAKYSSVVDLS